MKRTGEHVSCLSRNVGIDASTVEHNANSLGDHMPTIKAIEVRLEVEDVTRSAAFYADVLGFSLGTVWPNESPQFAILIRDGFRLQLGRHQSPTLSTSSRGCTLWLDVAGVVSMYSMIKGTVNIEWGPACISIITGSLPFETQMDI